VHAPAGDHEDTLSMIVSVVLTAVFALSLPSALRRRAPAGEPDTTRLVGLQAKSHENSPSATRSSLTSV
jgi:hypothetical protein